jgi:hypothetical protein
MTMRVLNPECQADAVTARTGANPRLESMEGKVIGILDNLRATRYFRHFENRLRAEFNPKEIVYLSKALTTAPATEDIIDELAARCDAVVVGVAM